MAIVTRVSQAVPVRKKADWLRTPQRVWLRRAIFQVHLWAGVTLALYCIVIGLSGSALVFRSEVDDTLHPSLVKLHPETPQVSMAEAVHNIEAERPGWRGIGLEDFDQPGRATILMLRRTGEAPTANYRLVSFNPYSGKVLLDRMRLSGVLGWLTDLHFYLLAGPVGLEVSGWMAVGLLVLCISGLILWWPGIRRWTSALVLRRRSRWQRTNWDLHVVLGFWCCVLLFGVTFSGVYFAFPSVVRQIVTTVTGGSSPVEMANTKPLTGAGTTRLTIDQAIAAARRALPAAPPAYLYLPDLTSGGTDPYSATGYYPGTAPYSQLARVTIDAHSGEILAREDTRTAQVGERIIQYFFAVHFGSFGGSGVLGNVIKLVWVLLGVTPALLAVTGLLMYWNRKLRPPLVRLRRS